MPGWFITINLVLEAWKIPGVLLVFSLYCKPEDAGSNISGRMLQKQSRKTEDKKSKAAIPSFISFYLDCHQKAPPSFATCLSTSNDQIKKIPHGNIQQLVFKLNPDSVKLTTKSELPLLNPLVLFWTCSSCLDKLHSSHDSILPIIFRMSINNQNLTVSVL